MLIVSRYQLGYYLGRVYGVLSVLFVLALLLRETVTLSAMAARSTAALRGQREALEAAMNTAPLETSLGVLVRIAVDALGDDARAAFYLADEQGVSLHHVVGMSAEYAEAVDGFQIGPESLACGLAGHIGEPVLTSDVANDPRWRPWLWLAQRFGYRGCWSFPIRTSAGTMVGTLAMYSRQPREATNRDVQLASFLCQTASVIIAQHKEVEARKRAVTELLDLQQTLKEADLRKDQFLAVLGHELRNPLAPLSAAIELLQRAGDKPELVDGLHSMMRRQLLHLTRLVDDLLDVSRITRDQTDLRRAPLDLRVAFESALEQARPMLDQRGHQLVLEHAATPMPLYGDFERLTQVFVNLLSNATRYMDPGGRIALRSSVEGNEVVVRVRDWGFGIPVELLEQVFDMFSQLPEHKARSGGGGLGIGLTLSRRLIELHGGSLTAASEGLGCGSEFNGPVAAQCCRCNP